MFIILSIYSKNLNSLTNFLTFFYKLKINKTLKLKFYSRQTQKKKRKTFFSVLRSPHVNKKSQEQFNYYLYSKKLKVHVTQVTKFLTFWKLIQTVLFSDIKVTTKFWPNKKKINSVLFNTRNSYKLKLDLVKNKKRLSYLTGYPALRSLDIYGEILIKNTVCLKY